MALWHLTINRRRTGSLLTIIIYRIALFSLSFSLGCPTCHDFSIFAVSSQLDRAPVDSCLPARSSIGLLPLLNSCCCCCSCCQCRSSRLGLRRLYGIIKLLLRSYRDYRNSFPYDRRRVMDGRLGDIGIFEMRRRSERITKKIKSINKIKNIRRKAIEMAT